MWRCEPGEAYDINSHLKLGITIYRDRKGGEDRMQTGMRIIYDQDGEIVASFGEMSGDVPVRKGITKLEHIDLEYKSINFNTHRIVKVDPETKLPVLERINAELTVEEKMQELEDQVLLMANENTGGIL